MRRLQLNSSSDINTEIVTNFSQLSAISESWERLRMAAPRPEIFMSFPWVRANWRAFGHDRKLQVVVVSQGGVPVGILPLAAHNRTLRFLASPNSDYNDLLAAKGSSPRILEEALNALSASKLDWEQCILENIPEGSNIAVLHEKLNSSLKKRVVSLSSTACPTLIRHDDDQQLNSVLKSSRNRQTVRRLEQTGELCFRHLSEPEEIRLHLPEFYRQHIRRWILAGHKSQFLIPAQRKFYDSLLDEIGSECLRFSLLELDGRAIAYHLGFEWNGKYIFYKPTFDIDFWDKSPGTVLLMKLLEYIKDSDIKEFDFATGGEWYKSRFANHSRVNKKIGFYRSIPRALKSKTSEYAKNKIKELSVPKTLFAFIKMKRQDLLAEIWSLRAAKSFISNTKNIAIYSAEESRLNKYDRIPEPSSGLNIRVGTLSDWADLAAVLPQTRHSTRIEDVRARLKQHEKFIIVEEDGEIKLQAWVAELKNESVAHGIFQIDTVRLERDAPILYDCYVPDMLSDPVGAACTFSSVINKLASEFGYMYICLEHEVAQRLRLEDTELQIRFLIKQVTVLSRFRRQGIRQYSASNG